MFVCEFVCLFVFVFVASRAGSQDDGSSNKLPQIGLLACMFVFFSCVLLCGLARECACLRAYSCVMDLCVCELVVLFVLLLMCWLIRVVMCVCRLFLCLVSFALFNYSIFYPFSVHRCHAGC